MQFTNRYEALGIPLPDPDTVCMGECEGTGFVPIFLAVNLPPPERAEVRLIDEADATYRALWFAAEALRHADDGWHFVRCPSCQGTGKQSASA